MRSVSIILLMAAACCLVGCIPLSIHPLYDSEHITFDEGLLGSWGDKSSPEDSWTFERDGEKGYRLIVSDEDNRPGEFEVNLVKLGNLHILDLYPKEPEDVNEFYKFHIIPAHSFMKMRLEGDTLELEYFDYDWLKKGLKEGRLDIKHELIDDTVILTASTERLQQFIVEYADEAFNSEDAGVLNRL
jgi:hypothetical protein